MVRLNTRPPTTPVSKPLTHEGAPAVRIGALAQLRRSVLACLLWEDTFYESGEEIGDRIAGLVPQVAPAIVANLALEARTRMKLRHVPLWLIRSLANGPKEGRWEVAQALEHCIQRPDELTEFLALYWKGGKQPLSAQVKKGLAAAFGKFDAYALAKYNRADTIKLRDVLFLCHAKPRDEAQALLWKRLIGGFCSNCWSKFIPQGTDQEACCSVPSEATLQAPDTWEVALSGGANKLETWNRLLAERKLGALALLRNLRNMQQVGVPDVVIAGELADMKVDRVLPYRFISAARHAPQLEPALEQAMYRCVAGAVKLPGRTVLLLDVSGSMDAPLSLKSELTRIDAACGLAILLRELCADVRIITFSNKAVLLPPRRGFALRDSVVGSQEHGGTYTEQGKQAADTTGYDRLIIITDEQSHQKITDPQGRGYVVNVAPYKNGIGYGAWTHIDGWSEAVVDYIQEVEQPA